MQPKPRYIDLSKCVGRGDCGKVCPVIIPDAFNEALSPRHVAYKLYPQAVPNAYAIEKRGIAPCRAACPAGQRAQGNIALIREGRWQDALRVIKMDNPFPGICGRICNHRCEAACNRGLVDDPMNIRALKRFVTDKVYGLPRQPIEPLTRRYDQRVAIIGAGPYGLTAAHDPTTDRGYWTLSPETKQRWQELLAPLATAIERNVGLILAADLIENLSEAAAKDRVPACCLCLPARIILVNYAVLDNHEIVCEACQHPFHPIESLDQVE